MTEPVFVTDPVIVVEPVRVRVPYPEGVIDLVGSSVSFKGLVRVVVYVKEFVYDLEFVSVKDVVPDRSEVPETVGVRVERLEAVWDVLPVDDPVGEEDAVEVLVNWAVARAPSNLRLGWFVLVPLDDDVDEIDLETEIVFTLDLELTAPVEEPLEEAVDDFVKGGVAVCLGSTLRDSIDDTVLTEVLEYDEFPDWLPCAENVRDPLDDAVVLRDRVGTVEVVCDTVEDLVLRFVREFVLVAEEDRDDKEDRDSVWIALLERLLIAVRVA